MCWTQLPTPQVAPPHPPPGPEPAPPKPLTPNQVVCLRPLLTPEARRLALQAQPTSPHPPLSLGGLRDSAAASVRAMWVAFHWSPSNPLLSAQQKACPEARAAFAGAVTTRAMVVPVGGWRWSESTPTPPWASLHNADVWSHEDWE